MKNPVNGFVTGFFDGSPGWTRTSDPLVLLGKHALVLVREARCFCSPDVPFQRLFIGSKNAFP